MVDIVVIGGGISGLTCSIKLLEAGFKVTLIESDSLLGGLASSFVIRGKQIPKTYHHFMPNEDLMFDLIAKCGFSNKLVWNYSNVCFWFKKKFYRLTSPFDIFKFKPLSWNSRFGLVRLGIISRLKSNWSDLKCLDAKSWVEKIVSKEATKKLFEPLAKIKFGSLSSVSAAWFGKRLNEASSNNEKYAYLDGGLQSFIDSLGQKVVDLGGIIHLNSEVTEINNSSLKFKKNKKINSIKFDKVVSSLPPPILLSKTRELSKNQVQTLSAVKYKPMVCAVIGSKQLLSPYYWNIFINPKYSFGGLFHHTALYPKGGINGEYVYYLFTYLDESDALYKKTTSEILNTYEKDLRTLCNDFSISWSKVFKIKYSSPIYGMDYQNLPIKITNWLYLTGVYRMYPNTRTMNTAAQSGMLSASKIISELKR